MKVLHPIVTPFTTAFYNMMALMGVFPQLDTKHDKRGSSGHHLRSRDATQSLTNTSSSGSSGVAQNANDIILERRRAKAIKVSPFAQLITHSVVCLDILHALYSAYYCNHNYYYLFICL